MKILDGKNLSSHILDETRHKVESLRKQGMTPGLATILIGDDPASHVYVGQKIKKCETIGIKSFHRPLPSNISQKEVFSTLAELNSDPHVHGIILQLPIPKHLDSEQLISAMDPKKDADGLHPLNQGMMARLKTWEDLQRSGIPLPCTPAGVIHMLLREKIPVAGKTAVVVGRSPLVGKPLGQLLLSLDATVTMAHSKTKNLHYSL